MLSTTTQLAEFLLEQPLGNGMRRARCALWSLMLRAALYCALLACLGAAWLATSGLPCRITLDQQLALFGFAVGGLGAGAFVLLAGASSLRRWWGERRSRAWRLP